MWTSKNRARYDRGKLRYPSDLTDDEWRLVEPLIRPGKTGGGKRTVIMREVVNGPDVRSLDQAPVWNVRTWPAMPREKAQAAPTARAKVPMRRRGADCPVVALKRGNARGANGAGHCR